MEVHHNPQHPWNERVQRRLQTSQTAYRIVSLTHARNNVAHHEACAGEDFLDTGIMTAAFLLKLVTAYPALRGKGVLRRVIGISERALKARLSRSPDASLSMEQSLRAAQLTEILAKATQVLGARDAAEAWMGRRAMGLDGMVPFEVLAMPDGFTMLRDHLIRMEYGVYI